MKAFLFIALLSIALNAQTWDSVRVQVGQTHSAAAIWKEHTAKTKSKPGLIIWLHGGMRSGKCEKGYEAGKALLPWLQGRHVVVASPSACMDRDWLSPAGLNAIESLIDTVAKRYPVDLSNLEFVAVSDGGFGVAHYSLQGKHAIARRVLISTYPGAWIPANALPQVASVLSRGSWLFLQGGRDQNFPAALTRPWMETFCAQIPNARLVWEPQGEHDISWWIQNRPDLLRMAFGPNKP
ncbi:MAG TPA: hypothetical protein VLM37_03350 [Fibrobacteraceae bacterium]|nr:hypothetical protein [Fibrobacteraceae bacterium]